MVPAIGSEDPLCHEHSQMVAVWTTNAMSTQLIGEYRDVMHVLEKEIGTTFERLPKAVFTIRILNNPAVHNEQ